MGVTAARPWARWESQSRLTPVNRNDVDEANAEGKEWADFLGVPFIDCKPAESRTPNTVPEYGTGIAPPPHTRKVGP